MFFIQYLDILQMNYSKQHEWLIGNVEKMVYVIKMICVNEIESHITHLCNNIW